MQFDLYKNPRAGNHPLLLDLQADELSQLESRIVAPLARLDRLTTKPVSRATVVVEIGRISYVVMVPLLAAMSRAALSNPVGSLASLRAELIAALDLVFTGS